MSKKDKKIEIQLIDAKVTVNTVAVEGYQLLFGKKIIGEIAELDGKYAVLKNNQVDVFYKNLNQAIQLIIETYNLNH